MAIFIDDCYGAELNFGHGDIIVTSTSFETCDGEIVGAVYFEQSNIGYEIGEQVEVYTDNQDVVMTFEKVESIDVVIRALEFAKQDMLGNE